MGRGREGPQLQGLGHGTVSEVSFSLPVAPKSIWAPWWAGGSKRHEGGRLGWEWWVLKARAGGGLFRTLWTDNISVYCSIFSLETFG